jgi:hypothetical protein
MDRRSTNVKGFVHYGGDVRSGSQDGIGFSLGSGSTGSTAWIESVSDDTNANLGIRAQGAGTITIGTSSNAVTMAGGLIAGAGAAIKGAYSTTFAWTLAALSSGQQLEVTLTTAVGGANPIAVGDLVGHLSLNCTNTQMGVTVSDIRWSATASSVLTISVGNITSTATSTLAGIGRITWLDLT